MTIPINRWQEVNRWRDAIREDLDLSSSQKLVALILSYHVNPSGSTFVGPTRIGRQANMHPRTVTRSLSELDEAGWIRIAREGGLRGGRKSANTWRLVLTRSSVQLGGPVDNSQRDPVSGVTRSSVQLRAHNAIVCPTNSIQELTNSAADAGVDAFGGFVIELETFDQMGDVL